MISRMLTALLASAALVVGCTDDSRRDVADATLLPAPDAGPQVAVSIDSGLDASSADASTGPVAPRDAAADAGLHDEQRVSLHFAGKVGAEELACDRVFAGQGTAKTALTVRDFRFFVSDVRLISANGSEVALQLDEGGKFQTKDLALVDLTDGKGNCGAAGADMNTIVTGVVPRGDYTGIVFSTSVPEALNHADPTLAPAPLRAPGVAWDWLQGYRFVLAEVVSVAGAASLDAGAPLTSAADASTPVDAGQQGTGMHEAVTHVGSTACLGGAGVAIHCDKPNRNLVRLDQFDATKNAIVADLGAVFAGVDLTVDAVCHGRGPACAVTFTALGIELATGAALATQSVFRVQ